MTKQSHSLFAERRFDQPDLLPDDPLAWLLRVARNALVSHFRRMAPDVVDPATLDLEAAAFRADSPEVAAAVGWGLSRLRRKHAEVLEAFYFDGKSTREIAVERRTTERAIEGALRRARAKLKKVLKPVLRPDARPRAIERGSHAEQTRTL